MLKPGESTSFTFPYRMAPKHGGPHHFQVIIPTNDPVNKKLVVDILANSIDR